MINLDQTYNTNSQPARPVVLYRAPVEESKGKQFVASALLVASISVISLQAGFVLNANAEGNPVSSPISTEESPSPSASASGNPVTAPEVTPSPSNNNSNNSGGTPSNNGGGNSGGSSSNSGGSSAPSCNNEAPKAPYIVSAVTTARNEITLTWSKPAGNVTHYSVAYGVVKNKPLYGAANVGNVTSYKVNGLSGGGTYFFTVKAVNDCTPSAASNEVGVKVGGKFISTPAQGFKPGVLGKVNQAVKAQAGKPALAKPIIFNQSSNQVSAGLAGKVFNFFKGFFN